MKVRMWAALVAVVCVQIMFESCQSRSNQNTTKSTGSRVVTASAEAEMSVQATEELNRVLNHDAQGKVLDTFGVKAIIESEKSDRGRDFCGIAFYVMVNGQTDPRFIYGSVGIGNSIEEAHAIALKEWMVIFVPTFARAIKLAPDAIEIEGLKIYASTLMTRSDSPLPLNMDAVSRSLIAPYISIIKKTYLHGSNYLLDMNAIRITISVDASGQLDGEWQFNGQLLPLLNKSATEAKLPIGGSSYTIKEFFLIRGGPVE